MRARSSLVPSLLLLIACGGDAPPPPAAPLARGPAASAPSAASSGPANPNANANASAPPKASSEPTELTAEQKAQDAALAPRAAAIVDAYPNWNGFFSSLIANYSP